MFGYIPGQELDETVQAVQIGDLSMRTDNKAVYYLKQAEALKDFNGPPVRRFTTPWFRGNLGLFHINISVIGPVPEEPYRNLPLSRGESQAVLEAIADSIKSLEEELR